MKPQRKEETCWGNNKAPALRPVGAHGSDHDRWIHEKKYRRPDYQKGNVSMTHNCKRKHQCTTMHDTKTADMSCIPTRKKDNEYESCLNEKSLQKRNEMSGSITGKFAITCTYRQNVCDGGDLQLNKESLTTGVGLHHSSRRDTGEGQHLSLASPWGRA